MKPPTVLVVDLGNTSTSMALYRDGRVTRVRRVNTDGPTTADIRKSLETVRGTSRIDGVSFASVVPSQAPRWNRELKRVSGSRILRVDHTSEMGMPITYPKPSTIGADRLANAVAAADLHGTPVVVADFGTALTFDVITARSGYVGGIIAPGLPLMFDYLAEKTALLPHLKAGPVRNKVGKSTEEAMRLGAKHGYRGMVREILRHLEGSVGKGSFQVCATGGYADWVLKGSGLRVVYEPDLTLYGLGRIYELNMPA